MFTASVCYKQDVPLDENYYMSKHMPMAEEILGSLGMVKAQVQKVVGTAAGSPPPYQIVTTFYFESPETFQAAFQNPAAAPLMADIPNFYQGQPDILVGPVILGG